MEYLTITRPGGPGSGFHVEGFPDAVKAGRLTGPKARRLAHLALHLEDLRSAESCLTTLASGHEEPIRSALWFTAVVHFMKCFGRSESRFALSAKIIYPGHSLALEAFHFFKAMRHKHYVHDENPFNQALPGVIINRVGLPRKIARVVTLGVRGNILSQENFTNLRLLIEGAIDWTTRQYDEVADDLTGSLEERPYDELLSLPSLEYKKPDVDHVAQTREDA